MLRMLDFDCASGMSSGSSKSPRDLRHGDGQSSFIFRSQSSEYVRLGEGFRFDVSRFPCPCARRGPSVSTLMTACLTSLANRIFATEAKSIHESSTLTANGDASQPARDSELILARYRDVSSSCLPIDILRRHLSAVEIESARDF